MVAGRNSINVASRSPEAPRLRALCASSAFAPLGELRHSVGNQQPTGRITMSRKIILIAALAFIAGVGTAQAQAPQPAAPAAAPLPGYGTSISVADAKKAAAAAIAE